MDSGYAHRDTPSPYGILGGYIMHEIPVALIARWFSRSKKPYNTSHERSVTAGSRSGLSNNNLYDRPGRTPPKASLWPEFDQRYLGWAVESDRRQTVYMQTADPCGDVQSG